jgi:hypothetical protein
MAWHLVAPGHDLLQCASFCWPITLVAQTGAFKESISMAYSGLMVAHFFDGFGIGDHILSLPGFSS